MSREPSDKPYSEEESQRRFEAALKGALKTPHKPHKPDVKKSVLKKGSATKPSPKS